MRWLLLPVTVVVLVACGSSTPPAGPGGGTVANTAVDAGIPALGAGCPARWSAVSGACDPSTVTSLCNYVEGTAYCGVAPRCSGVAPDPDAPPGPTSWQRSERPPDVRADGCPGVEPEGACWNDGKVCSYGDCCFRELTCRDGGWTMTGGGCPP